MLNQPRSPSSPVTRGLQPQDVNLYLHKSLNTVSQCQLIWHRLVSGATQPKLKFHLSHTTPARLVEVEVMQSKFHDLATSILVNSPRHTDIQIGEPTKWFCSISDNHNDIQGLSILLSFRQQSHSSSLQCERYVGQEPNFKHFCVSLTGSFFFNFL